MKPQIPKGYQEVTVVIPYCSVTELRQVAQYPDESPFTVATVFDAIASAIEDGRSVSRKESEAASQDAWKAERISATSVALSGGDS